VVAAVGRERKEKEMKGVRYLSHSRKGGKEKDLWDQHKGGIFSGREEEGPDINALRPE